MKASQMFASPASVKSDSLPPLPPTLPEKKRNAKEQAHSADKTNLHQFIGFDMTTIPGIGYQTAAVIAAELGALFDRFPNEHHFASYIGLAPSLGKSAGKNVRQKKRCKNTSGAGQALRMAAATLYRSQTELGAFFRNAARRTDKKTAVKATARRMSRLIFRGARFGQQYLNLGLEAYEARLRSRTVNTVKRLVKSFDIYPSEILSAFSTEVFPTS